MAWITWIRSIRPPGEKRTSKRSGALGTTSSLVWVICAMERMREVVARARPEVIIHLAARAGKFSVPPTLTRS